MEQVSSPGSASSTLLEEHHGDEDDEYDEDDATEETEIQSCDHEEVPIETVVPPNRPSTSTYDAIVASEGKIVDAENRRHSDMMTVLERMIGLQEETVSQLAHLHRVFIEVPKQLQKINTSFEALVVQQTQANYWRMTNVPQFNTSQPGSVHAGQFSPHSSDIHSPGPNVTGQVADIAVQVPDDILPLPSVQIQQQTPTKEATKTKQDTHETDQPSLVQCLPTCSHVSLGTSPVREQSLPKSPVGESLPKSPVGESLPKSPVGESLPKSPVGESLPKSPVGESLPKSPEVYEWALKWQVPPQQMLAVGQVPANASSYDICLLLGQYPCLRDAKILGRLTDADGVWCSVLVSEGHDLAAVGGPSNLWLHGALSNRCPIIYPNVQMKSEPCSSNTDLQEVAMRLSPPSSESLCGEEGSVISCSIGHSSKGCSRFTHAGDIQMLAKTIQQLGGNKNKPPQPQQYRKLKIFSGVKPTPVDEEAFDAWKDYT
ncbi:uncharacterized protein LOC142501456 [Ascaphus truei]|uniref:uncharacterized protein LOC142501456 n=1 Tax=Ascaphus truei TaxID=8439 RepID=UPI003F5AA6B0